MNFEDLLHLLYLAYRDARKHKRNTINQLQFEKNLEHSLFTLAFELYEGSYELSPSICFINELPVKREIIAADFRDRVVHHLLYNWLYPIFDRQFIYDSYSCRIGKGTLFGINRARAFAASESKNFSRECFSLRLDISGFFMAINRDVLYRLIVDGVNRSHWGHLPGLVPIPDKNLCDFLINKFVYNNPLEQARFKSPSSAWDELPPNKSLMNAGVNNGLPIGNLTSQLFGNVYLNPLDQYIKRTLKIRYYGRYVDDMLFVHRSKSVLLEILVAVREFLNQELKLILNEKKTKLQPIQNGFSFLGAYILPWRMYPSRRVVKNFRNCVNSPLDDVYLQGCRMESYLGLLKHYDASRLSLIG